LLRAIVGVQKVAGGSVDVLGEPAGSSSLRPRVGYVTQAPSVYADLTVRENLLYFGRVLRTASTRVQDVAAAVGLGDFTDRSVASLSGGERARVSLATALLNQPPVLVLDEPTVGLDPVLRRDLWQRFRAFADGGATLLVSSHVMDEASHCDELVLLRDGRTLAQDAPDRLLEVTGAASLDDAFLRLIERDG